MKQTEVIERVRELMHEKENLIREHEDLFCQLEMILNHLGDKN